MTSPVPDPKSQELVDLLDGWAESAKFNGEGVVVTLPSGRVMELVLTPVGLDMIRVAFGAALDVFEYQTECPSSMPERCDHLVYTQYDVKPEHTNEAARYCRVDCDSARWRSSPMNTSTTVLVTAPVDDGRLRLAVAAFMARYKGRTRKQHEANLPFFVEW